MASCDPHIHMTSRTTNDYVAMAEMGITLVIEPSFWLGQPRTSVGTFEDYFLSLMGWERFRANQFGLHHFCTIALNPKEANNPSVCGGVMEVLPRYLAKDSVVAVGEIGLDDQTPQEEVVFQEQIQMAKDHHLPILVHTPHRDKKNGTIRCLDIVKEGGIDPSLVLIDHANEQTIATILDYGFWAGHSIYPDTKMDPPRMTAIVKKFGSKRIIVNSAADWGVSDPLLVPKTAAYMEKNGVNGKTIQTITWQNPVTFFAQSGKMGKHPLMTLSTPHRREQSQLFAGNSVLWGQAPQDDPR